jgi:hypothetical protein
MIPHKSSMKISLSLLIVILSFAATAAAQESFVAKQTRFVALGETRVKVTVHEKPGAAVTFFAPHGNEQTAVDLAREFVAQSGGRLVAIESFDAAGNPARRVAFSFKGRSYSLDPNRIFTVNGRRCGGFAGEIERAVAGFAAELLRILFDENSAPFKTGEKLVVAVHNNTDSPNRNAGDLTATAFAAQTRNTAQKSFEAQAAGVYLANAERDADNFVFLSSTRFVGFFARKGFNVVVQKPNEQLFSAQCAIDDGSLSVYAGQENIEYICLEADAAGGAARQRKMFEAVYLLFEQPAAAITTP